MRWCTRSKLTVSPISIRCVTASPLKHCMIGRYLPTAVAEPANLTARGGMQVGACLAGVAFLKGLGLVHRSPHGRCGVRHTSRFDQCDRLTCGSAFNAPDITDKVRDVAGAGLDGTDFETSIRPFAGCSTDLLFRNLCQRSVCRWMPRGASPRKPIWMRPPALIHDPPTSSRSSDSLSKQRSRAVKTCLSRERCVRGQKRLGS